MFSSQTKKAANQFTLSFNSGVLSKTDIIQTLHKGLIKFFSFSSVNIYLLDPNTLTVDYFYPQKNHWPIPNKEKLWLLNETKELLIQNRGDKLFFFYIADRKNHLFTDSKQLEKDQLTFKSACQDNLYIVLVSEDEMILGIISINNWKKQSLVCEQTTFGILIETLRSFISKAVTALDNFYIHQKIETLLTDKMHLKRRIQKDEEDLKRRILELSVLYDTSNSLSYSLDYEEIVNEVTDGLSHVLSFDICTVFLLDFVPDGELFITLNNPLPVKDIYAVQVNLLSAAAPFTRRSIKHESVGIKTRKKFIAPAGRPKKMRMKSFANVPLFFKDEIIGMMNICSTSKNVFTRNEMTFIHTMANQLSSHLGRLKITKKLEKSKINSLIESISEGLIMFDPNNQLHIINPAANKFLGIKADSTLDTKTLMRKLSKMGLKLHYEKVRKNKIPITHKHILFDDKFYSVNISPVKNADGQDVGNAMVFNDVTELQMINRIKSQRLEVISKFGLILQSIGNLDNLLPMLMQFILLVAKAELGSIQLVDKNMMFTKVHSNFPEKILKTFRLKTGEAVTDYVLRTKEIVVIKDCYKSPKVDPKAKLVLDSFICIPIMANRKLIGLVNIARQLGNTHPRLTKDDLDTLSTITTLSGSAIQNAIYYMETLQRQKLDQEIKVASEIQRRLLPKEIPFIDKLRIGSVSSPARVIGGDFYDFFQLPNNKLGIIIADIVGKGVSASLFMAMLKSILRTHIQEIESPGQALETLNKILYKDPVIERFIPLFFAVYDPETLKFTYCNAGHEPAIIFSSKGCYGLDTKGFPLGAYFDSEFEEKYITLEHNDVILIYTDGVVESRNLEGQQFGLIRLQETIGKHKSLEAQQISDKILNAVQVYSQSQEQHDDITIITLKIDDKLKTLTREEPEKIKKLLVSSAKRHIKEVREEIGLIAREMGFGETEVYNIKLAINEAHANVIEHAYLGSEKGQILFKISTYSDRLEVLIKDFSPVGLQKSLKGAQHLHELEGSGFGVFLINSVMDKTSYRHLPKSGTEFLLTKYKKKEKQDGSQ
ncbi:SpoIIE family protein phosphatase [Thermoproteota archaeon]